MGNGQYTTLYKQVIYRMYNSYLQTQYTLSKKCSTGGAIHKCILVGLVYVYIYFLDLKVKLDNGTIETEKKSHAFLPPSSCHPHHTFKSIPYSQALRVRRNCSQPETTSEKHLENLQQYLENCNYPPHQTQYQINRARPHSPRRSISQERTGTIRKNPVCYYIHVHTAPNPQTMPKNPK